MPSLVSEEEADGGESDSRGTEHQALPGRNFETGSRLVVYAEVTRSEDMHVMGRHWHKATPPHQWATTFTGSRMNSWIRGDIKTLLDRNHRLLA